MIQSQLKSGIPSKLPPPPSLDKKVPHAPKRNIDILSKDEIKLAIRNALRYFPSDWHEELAREFLGELINYGRIYMYRFRPTYNMHGRPLHYYGARCHQAAAIMLMIQNNLDPLVAKYPHELITYGGNGAVFQNWAQYLLTMEYLQEMTNEQTLVLYSGHPMGLFPSHKNAPRVVVTNGMMIPNHSSKEDWNRYNALGVTSYGQMTAGSFMYIGPQGIVHGTTITLLNAARRKDPTIMDLKGKIFITSGLGGMSGAQALAGIITGAITVIAEVDEDCINQRIADGYIIRKHVFTETKTLLKAMKKNKEDKMVATFIFFGNIVDLWQAIVDDGMHIDLGSDQTSLHNIDDLGYCPQGMTFIEAKAYMLTDKAGFMESIKATLRKHVEAINAMVDRGMYFWDYGNAFLKEAGEANADVWKDESKTAYKFPSYVQDIMGPLCFDYGFGPFRWVCTSGSKKDLDITDAIALEVMERLYESAPDDIKGQLNDNIIWIKNADQNIPIVGTKARILYADAEGRIEIAKAFNEAIKTYKISAPIVLGRDHHDVSGTDSPYRETSNIYDGSKYTADMAVHNFVGDAFRGATWISLHNGGGVGWGEVINGGFGMVIDGTDQSAANIKSMLHWDVNNGIARRSWARNKEAMSTIERAMEAEPLLKVTMPAIVHDSIIEKLDL